MRKKVKILGKNLPIWLLATVLLCLIGIAVAVTIIGTITMHWEVSPPPPPPPPSATMTPSTVTLDIGTVYFGETKTVEPTDVADLTVENGAVDITIELGGEYGGFDALSVTVQLVQDGEVKYEAVITPTIVVSSVLHPSPTGVGGWSDKTASQLGYVETCFVRVLSGEGDLAQLVKWAPGATITVDGATYEYPNTPFGYTYDDSIPETGYIFQNDNDAGESIQLVLVYPSTSAIIEDVAPGTYDVYVG
ncbi:hypothetical protein DRO69_14485, partial [Candidatus Bathyarchaeota archaeon]